MLRGLLLELAGMGGWSFGTELLDRGAVILPLSGVRLTSAGGAATAVCVAHDGLIEVRWGAEHTTLRFDTTALVSPPGSAQIEVVASERVRGMRVDGPATQDFGLGAPQATVRAPAALTVEERQNIDAALSFLSLADAGVAAELVASDTCLTALRSRAELARQSYSVEAVPRVVYCAIDDPFELADVICHEYHHLKLFLVEESHKLLSNPQVPAIAPWRRDIRAARGVLHGLYVFFVLANVVGGLFDIFPPSPAGLRKLIMWRTVVEKGVECLRQTDWSPTDLGAQLLSEIDVRNGDRLARLRQTERDLATLVSEMVDDHVTRLREGEQSEPAYTGF
jgi:HEXXH motif-containing protein